MPFAPGPHRTRGGLLATVTGTTGGTLHGFIGDAPYAWTEDGRVPFAPSGFYDLLYRDEPDDDQHNHSKEVAMPAHENTQWDYDMLQQGIAKLEWACKTTAVNDGTAHGEAHADALRHTIAFIEWNMEQGDILSPLQTYLTQK